jgi:hypothetical protein
VAGCAFHQKATSASRITAAPTTAIWKLRRSRNRPTKIASQAPATPGNTMNNAINTSVIA